MLSSDHVFASYVNGLYYKRYSLCTKGGAVEQARVVGFTVSAVGPHMTKTKAAVKPHTSQYSNCS